jgi:hypothetical protein
MKRLFSVAVVAMLLAACASPLPQTPPAGLANEVAAPSIQPGSVWRYAVQDGYTHLSRGTIEYRVTDVMSDSVAVAVDTGAQQTTETYTRDWNWLVHPATNMQTFIYKPAYQAYQFPLVAGKKWTSTATATDPATGRSFPIRVEAEVLGWQKVRVPAGEFDTVKVLRRVYFDYWQQGVRGESWIIETDWYAPSVNQVARRETTSRYWRLASSEPRFSFVRVKGDRDGDAFPRFEQDDWLVYELTEYAPR